MISVDTILLILIAILMLVIPYLSIRKLKNLVPETIEYVKIQGKRELEIWLNSETGQKALYSIGALVGHGAIAGAGISKKGGKFKWEDLASEIAGRFVENIFTPKPAGSKKPPPSTSSGEGLKSA